MSRFIPVDPEKWGEMVKAMAENARLKAELARLRASSFVTAVPVEQYERVVKAGDAVSICLEAYWKGKPYHVSMTIECFDAWNAAKEGKPSV